MIYEKPKNEIFASDAKDGEIVEFPNVKRGWGVTENLGFIPPMEYFNAAFNRVDKSLAYQLQRGVSEWDKDLEYPIGAVVSLNGIIYIAKSQNTNKNPANEATIWDVVATQKWCDNLFVKKSELKDGIPVGSYLLYSSNTNTPDGFLRCDGSALDKNTYSALFEVIGYTYGRINDKFLLPNFADGKFMRSTGGGAATLGAAQQDAINTKKLQIRSITTDNVGNRHIYGTNTTSDFRGVAFTYSNTGSDLEYKSVAGKDNADIFSSTKKADETRPYNMAVVVIIKAKNVNTPIAGQIDKTILATEAKSGIVKLKNSITAKQEDAAVTEKAVAEAIEANKGLGIGQAWQNMTTQRKKDIVYTNTTNRAIMINVAGVINNSSEDIQLSIDNFLAQKINIGSRSGYVCAVVPAGATYKITTSSNSQINPSSFVWMELR